MRKFIFTFITALTLTSPVTMAEEIVIIVAPENSTSLEIEDVARIYLGKRTRLPSGEEVTPLDLQPNDPTYREFSLRVLNKTPNQLRAYWAKRIFTGKGKPPRVVRNAEEMQRLVGGDIHYLGYVNGQDITDAVRPVVVTTE
ncbi:MAG: phosphate ABC transporter substrate-binding protein [Pseudomonadota bacterium]